MSTSTHTQHSTKLRRPTEGRIIAGVAAGLGNRFSANPWWFRVGLIVLAFFGGFGIVLYAIGWLLIPEEGSDQAILSRWISDFDTSNTPMVVGVGLVAAAALILAGSFDLVSGNLLLAAVLFVIGVLLYRGDIGGAKQTDDPDPDDGGGKVAEDTMVDSDTALALDEPGAGSGAPPEDTSPAAPEPPPPEAKPRSILGQLTMAATFIAVGGLALLDAAGILYPGFVHYVAVVLGVIGGGLLLGAFFGRARWLIVIGLLLVPVLLVASVIPRWSFSGEVGEEFINPANLAEIEQPYELAAGSLHIDLTSLENEVESAVRIPVDVGVGAGEIRIDVPEGVAVHVEASVGVGVVDLFGDERAGLGVSETASTGEPPVFVITAEAGAGSIVVRER